LGASTSDEGDTMKNIRYIVIGLVVVMTMIPLVSAGEIWSGWVYSKDGGSGATGAIVTTPDLPSNAVCTVTAKEIFWYNWAANLKLEADAQCYQTSAGGAFIPAPDGHSFLQLGTGEPLDVSWGPCTNSHVYTYDLLGTGDPLNLRIYDWIDGDVTNNNCHLPVTVSCEAAGGDGCWITGGGRILNEDGTYDSYGGNAMTMKDGSVRGEWNHVDHNGGGDTLNHFKGDVTTITCSKESDQGPRVPKAIPNYAIFGGTGTYNGEEGYTFVVDWVDSWEGGRSWDRYQLTITAPNGEVIVENGIGNTNCKPQSFGAEFGCTMDGNLQIHPPNQ
jgi:hypothetical protein